MGAENVCVCVCVCVCVYIYIIKIIQSAVFVQK